MTNSLPFKVWLGAARLRTLPLALAAIILGGLLALSQDAFSLKILIWSIITAICYQVLSNFANDLGDGLKGTDANRIGEKRAVASGIISQKKMKNAVILFTALSLASGTYLSIIATSGNARWFFIGLGILATLAALGYTLGKRAYGYNGFGDIFVIVFFGWVGVIGAHYLHTNAFSFWMLLPATAVGMLAAGVLNLNNMRDIQTDTAAKKSTLVVKIGLRNAKIYHTFLLLAAPTAYLVFCIATRANIGAYVGLAVVPVLIINLKKVWSATIPQQFDLLLKPLALTTLLFCLLAGIGHNL